MKSRSRRKRFSDKDQKRETEQVITKSSSRVSAEDLPRKTLEESVKLAQCLHSDFAGEAGWDDIADGLKIGRTTNSTKYLFWSAIAYGIVIKDEGNRFTLAETGRKIIAPVYEGEKREAKIKALLTPNILSKFFTDYNGHQIPSDEIFPNVLERKYNIPHDRLVEAQAIIISNAEYSDVLINTEGRRVVSLGKDSPVPERPSLSEVDTIENIPTEITINSEWEKICFYVTPIGEENSEVRKHSDMMLKHLIDPVLSNAGLKVIRADKIEKSGLITQQIFEHLAHSKLCIADLSFNNPNAFYELGIRHMCMLPTIQVIRKGDKIPFDVLQGRTIVVDTSDVYTVMDKFESGRKELSEHVKHCLSDNMNNPSEDNPVATYLPNLKVIVPKPKST